MNKIFSTFKYLFFLLFLGVASSLWAQGEDFAIWTKFKADHKIDSRFSVSGDLEFRVKDQVKTVDRVGLVIGGHYDALPFLKLHLGYETHYRNLGESGWRFRHRYHLGATATIRYEWLKISLRERIQQTFDRGETETRLRSRLKLSVMPNKGVMSPYFAVEVYQSLGDASFWKAARVRYRPGVEFELSERWGMDVFYCYQHATNRRVHITGLEVTYSF